MDLIHQRLGLLFTILVLTLYSPINSAETKEIKYIKLVDPKISQKLEEIEQCRVSKLSVEDCKAKLNPKITKPVNAPAKKINWWLTSAYDKQQPVEGWQHAFLSTVSLLEMNGNLEGSQHSVRANYYSRYGAFTNELSSSYSKDNVKQNDFLASDRETLMLSYSTRFDINSNWFNQIGYINGKDTSLFLEKNDVYYVGLGTHILNSRTLSLSAFIGFGRQSEAFSEQSFAATGLKDYEYNIAYVSQQFMWHITPNLSFSESLGYFDSLEDIADFDAISQQGAANPNCIETLTDTAIYCVIGYEDRNKIQLNLALKYQLNRYFSLSYGMSFSNNSEPFIADSSTNSSHNFAISFNFQ